MASRATFPDFAERDRRQQCYVSAGSIGAKFPKAGKFAVELSFTDPAGALRPSSYRQLYEPTMQAYFELRCPLHECMGGGFDVNTQIASMLANPSLSRTGTAACAGSRVAAGVKQRCNLQLKFVVAKED